MDLSLLIISGTIALIGFACLLNGIIRLSKVSRYYKNGRLSAKMTGGDMRRFLLILSTIFIIAGCATSGTKPVREFNKHGIKSYIVDKWHLRYYARGVYDINRNDEVDVGIDMFFFTKNTDEEGGAHVWYLHDISYWEVDGDDIVFAISPYPVKISVDNDDDADYDGVPDIRYFAKPGIEHPGLLELIKDNKIGD